VAFAAGEIRSANVTNKQCVAGQNFLWLWRIVILFPHSPLPLFPLPVFGDQHRNTLWRMPRCLHDPQDDFADFNLVTVFHSPMRKRRARFLTKYDLGAGPGRELAMPADEIRVQVRLDHILDLETLRFSFVNVLIDIALRINHHCLPFRTNQVRSMCQTAKIELFEVHMNLPRNAPAFFPGSAGALARQVTRRSSYLPTAIYKTRVPVSRGAASNKVDACRPVKTYLPAASWPTTSDKPDATSPYRQTHRRCYLQVQLCARVPPGASNAFPKSDPDGPEKSCSDARPRHSTKCATCPGRWTRKARRLSRDLVPTPFLHDRVSPSPSFDAGPSHLVHPASSGPCDANRRRCLVECLPSPRRARRSNQFQFRRAAGRQYARRVLPRGSYESKADLCARFRRATWRWHCACEFARASERSKSESFDLPQDCQDERGS